MSRLLPLHFLHFLHPWGLRMRTTPRDILASLAAAGLISGAIPQEGQQ
jgi:hypothetical protein